MGDENHPHVALALQIPQQVHDLGLTVTSRAVVGSSAISTFGSRLIAIAIMMRWRMPPENWCG